CTKKPHHYLDMKAKVKSVASNGKDVRVVMLEGEKKDTVTSRKMDDLRYHAEDEVKKPEAPPMDPATVFGEEAAAAAGEVAGAGAAEAGGRTAFLAAAVASPRLWAGDVVAPAALAGDVVLVLGVACIDRAYLDLIKGKDLCSSEGANMVPYDSSKFAVLRGSVEPRPLRPRLPSEARRLLDHEGQTIYRAAADIDRPVDAGETPQIRPYWDASLRFSSTMWRIFTRALRSLMLVSFRRCIAHRVGCFFAAKKNGDIRLVIDGREPSGGFYQFVDQDLASLRLRLLGGGGGARWHGCARVLDETSQSFGPASGDSRVCLAFCGLPMGWSWSFYFCRQVLGSALEDAVEIDAGPCLLREGHSRPALAFGRPLVAPYVDSGALIGSAPAAAAALDTLRDRHLAHHEVVEPADVADVVRRLYFALEYLIRRVVASGHAMRPAAGRVVNHFMLARGAVAALDHVYGFIVDFGPGTGRFSVALTTELRAINGLVFLCQADLAAPWSRVAFASDSSMLGYALHIAAVEPDEVVRAARYKERW
ncbi:unnamed protein product, partial [Prorocentrum cordatum]